LAVPMPNGAFPELPAVETSNFLEAELVDLSLRVVATVL
jgi:hypothetical protein